MRALAGAEARAADDARGPTSPLNTRLPRAAWVAIPGLVLLAFWPTPFIPLMSEDFYWVPRLLDLPFAATLRQQWLLQPTPGDFDPQSNLQFYRPLGYMWLHARVLFWRAWPPGLRLDPLLLHTAAALGVAALATRWTHDRWLGVLAGALAVVAPGRVTVVSALWGTNNLWGAVLSLLAIILMHHGVRDKGVPLQAGSLFIALVATLFYEQAIVALALSVVLVFVSTATPLRRCLLPGAVALALTAAYFAFRLALYGDVGGYTSTSGTTLIATHSLWQLFIQVVHTQWRMLLCLITPFQPPIADWPQGVGLATLGAWILGAAVCYRRCPALRPALLAASLWVIVTTLPFTGILAAPSFWASYPYYGSLGSAIVAAIIIRGALPDRAQPWVVAGILALSIATTWVAQAMRWKAGTRAQAFVAALQAAIPPDRTPAIAVIDNLPGASAYAGLNSFLSPQDHDTYTGYLPNRLFLRPPRQAWPRETPLGYRRTWPPVEDLQLHWLAWDAAAQVLSPLPGAPTPRAGTALVWDFERPGDVRVWKPAFQLVRLRPAPPGPPAYTVDGELPFLTGPPLPATLGTPIYAEVTMTVTAPRPGDGIAEWHFRTADAPEPSPAHVVRFWIAQDGRPHTYRVPLVHNPQLLLDGPPTQLDLRPTSTPGAVVQLRSIRLIPRTAGSSPTPHE